MNKSEVCSMSPRWLFLLVVLAVCAFVSAHAQDTPPVNADKSASSAQSQDKDKQSQETQSQDQSQPQTSTKPTPAPDETDKPDVKITPRQAEELFHSVDEILDFDSKQTGLPVRHNVKRRLTSRDEVVSYLTKHMDDEDTKRMLRSELVLKKFGLVPRDFDLEKLMIALLREEVAGYYDPKTKTVNLLDWVPMEEQEPVMAHELTHALQDQTIHLDKWMRKGDRDLAEVKKDITSEDIENDEISDAREAVIEGQAQAMAFEYAIAPTGHTITDSPALVEAMEEETTTGTGSTKVFNSAPIFMQEELTFPYSYGMEFIVQVLRKGGKEKAFADVLRDPPHTTRQIMEPETYLSGEKLDPMPVANFKQDFKDYEKFDIGSMGEFDVAVLIEQFAGKAASKRMYPAWRGGYYYAAKTKGSSSGAAMSTASLGILYVSRWSDADKAAEFAAIYAHSLRQRYKQVDGEAELPARDESISESTVGAEKSPTTEPGDANPGNTKSVPEAEPKLTPLTGRHVWNTEEGTIVIEEQGNTVLVSESLDAATTANLEKEVFGSSTISATAK
jgi:hypothetical protein